MKIKKWHLFAFIITLFLVSFFVINLKFDKFYRLNGINNDNRVLIENYLDEDEQEYLVENQIHIDEFIQFIEIPDFKLNNYQYYNLLDQSKRYSKKSNIIYVGNNLATRLEFLYGDEALTYAKQLVNTGLEDAFIHSDNFDFKYLNIYKSLKTIYSAHDYSYVDDTLVFIAKLKLYHVVKIDDINKTIDMLCKGYTKESLKSLIDKSYDPKVMIVYDPYEFTTIVDKNHFIGEYNPKELLLTQDLPRVRYSMYLQKDAYLALVKMYQALSEEYDQFLLVSAYSSYDTIYKENAKLAGYSEEQLGLTVRISQRELAYNQFDETKMSQWLQKHAHEYGFVLRYPKNKASITNHAYDAHTYRYVGKSLAKTLYESNMTLDEYISQQGE